MNPEMPRSPRGDLTLSGFVAAACVAVLLVAAAYWLSLQQSRAAAWVNHSHEVLATIARTRAALVDIQNGHRGFTISGREADLDPYARARAAITIETARLRALLAGNPDQQQRLADLERGLAARLASAAELVEARRAGGFEAAKAIVDTGLPNEEMDGLRALLNGLETEAEQLLRDRLDDHGRRLQWFWAGMTALVAGLFAALAVLYLQVRRRRAAQQALLDREHGLGEALRAEMAERLRVDQELQRLNRSLETLVRERTAELRSANEGLRDAELRMRDLSSQLIAAQEQERRRIARELHDDTGQLLTVMRMHLSDLQRGAAGATERLPDCIAVVDGAIAQIRAMALNLRPTMLDDLGLADALQWALAQQAKAAGWKTELDADDLPVAIPADVQTACFRIGQEALANAARHAGATHVRLVLRMVGRELELTVRDNGAGFDLAHYQTPEERRKHFGVMSMTERASLVGGTLDIETGPGSGTRIRVRVPIQPEAVLAE
jgi:signal transduction histidine kinase